jgi:hypothetical protein
VNKKLISLSLFLIIGIVFSNQIFAKNKKVKFGKVSLEELEMKEYAPDTSAVAVILYERGYYDATNHQFYAHRRIKILKKEAYSLANNEFYTSSRGSIKGYTFNLANGEIEKSELTKENIYEEKLFEQKYLYNVAMPNVKVGSVMDIRIKYDGFPINWYFQHDIPVIFSECELGDNPSILFRKQEGGVILPSSVGYNHWVAENVPAFVSEPYLSSSKNYKTRVEFDISQTSFPGYYMQDYAASWKSVDNILQKYSRFGKILELSSAVFLNKTKKEIESTATNDTEKVQMAVEAIKNIMEWNGNSRMTISENTLSEVANNKKGNSADINIMLIKLIDKLDIEVYPLVMSTRSNGMLHPTNPTLWKLNYVLACARVNGNFMVLDATSDLLPYDMLPIRCLNYFGRVLDNRATSKVSLIPEKKYLKSSYYDLVLDENNLLSGKISFKNIDYSAYDFRLDYEDFLGDQEYVEDLMNNYDGLIITDFAIENVDVLEKPVVEKYDVEIEDAFTVIDNQLFLNMFLFERMEDNPFKTEERNYPVDFTYARSTAGVIRIKLPENYSVEELPKPIILSLPENSAMFTMNYQNINNVLTLTYKLTINRIVFGERVYPNIKEFFAQVVNNQNIPIVININ